MICSYIKPCITYNISSMGSKSSSISTNSAKLSFGNRSGEGTARRCCCKHVLRLSHRCQKERERSVFWSSASAHTYLDNFVTLAKYDCVIPISQIRGSVCKFEEVLWQWQSLLVRIFASTDFITLNRIVVNLHDQATSPVLLKELPQSAADHCRSSVLYWLESWAIEY